jgi:3-hydroxyisobutyrate dehydrogenase-like beta-hydroxyacid dehydrogenase
VDLNIEAAAAAGVDLRLKGAARTWIAEAEEAGWGDRDYAAVLARILGAAAD